MSEQLRYYIALGAPPTRAPMAGNEPFMRAEAGFNPSWFHQYCGVDFSERWHEDAAYRLRCAEKMRAEAGERFGGRSIGVLDKDGTVDLVTGLYGTAVVPAVFGQSIRYFPDKWPVPHGQFLSDSQAGALKVPDLENNVFFQGILDQLDQIKTLTGSVAGFLNWQGVLNTAFRLRGESIFMDILQEPGRADHIFGVVAETMIRGIRMLHDRQRRLGTKYTFATVSNCVVNMIGPEQYREHLLPHDLRIRGLFEDFGIHNCAWVVDPYMDSYASVPGLGYIDMGITSDLAKARRLFPDTRRTILYTSMDLSGKSLEQIRADFERIASEFAPCDVGLPDIEADVPDERVTFAMDLCEQFSERA